MSVDTIAQFTYQQSSARWLSEAWFAFSEAELALYAQFKALQAEHRAIRDFEKRCVEALRRSNPDTTSHAVTPYADMTNLAILRALKRQLAGTPMEVAYKSRRAHYNAMHREAWTEYGTQREQLRKLRAITKRYEKRFGFEREASVLAQHLDSTRDEERWSFLDAFFEEREMPGHNLYVCPVCAPVAKNGTVADYAIQHTSYVDARCRNFDCSRYGERLMTLDSFEAWLRHGSAEANGLGQERFEYEIEFGWEAREGAKLAEQAKVAERAALRDMSPRMQDVRQRALQKSGLWDRMRALRRTAYAEKRSYSRKQAPLAMPVRGADAAGSCEWVEESNPYLNKKRPYTHLRAEYMHRKPARWERDYGFESPECWDYTLNPIAIGVRSSGSLVMASR